MSTTDPSPSTPRPARNGRRLVKTSTPGIYRKERADGSPGSYVVIYRAGGKQRKESARTLAQARAIRSARLTDAERGEFQPKAKVTLHAYLREWIEHYQGNGRRGFRENTRVEYRRLLDAYALSYFGERLRLADVTPHHLAQYAAWLADEGKQGRRLADETIANAVNPVRAALGSAVAEGLLRANPAAGLRLPHREQVQDDDGVQAKAFSSEQLAAVLALAPARHRLLLELLAGTGLRVSEALALQRRHLALDGEQPQCPGSPGAREGHGGPPEVEAWAPQRTPITHAGGPAARSPGRSARLAGGARLRNGQRDRARRGQSPQADAQAAGGGSRRPVGGVPHVPSHLRLDAALTRRERCGALAGARALLPQGHARCLLPPARG